MENLATAATAPQTIDPGKPRLTTLRLLRDLTLEQGYPPSLRALAKALHLSVAGVKKHLDWLAVNGLVAKNHKEARSAVLTEYGRLVLRNRKG